MSNLEESKNLTTFSKYEKCIDNLHSFVVGRYGFDFHSENIRVDGELGGYCDPVLHKMVSKDLLKQNGVFFTPDKIVRQLFADIDVDREGGSFYDPCCGSGNLLVECAKNLPLKPTFDETLESWGRKLGGNDLYQQFIDMAKLRIALIALERGGFFLTQKIDVDQIFPNIYVSNSLDTDFGYNNANFVIMNPPFNYQNIEETRWANGKTNSASVHFLNALNKVGSGTTVAAVLPDVLRSGTRYEEWRKLVSERIEFESLKLHGQFTKNADIHTFHVVGKSCRESSKSIWPQPEKKGQVVSSNFWVKTGPVVPHRHPDQGRQYPYLHARNSAPWGEMEILREKRGFGGTLYEGPFVVIRRTSRPDDRYRAVGTIISDPRRIAVENHLIIMKPKSGSVECCRKLLDLLRDDRVNEWLNYQIRCRHLTVRVLSSLPTYDYFEDL